MENSDSAVLSYEMEADNVLEQEPQKGLDREDISTPAFLLGSCPVKSRDLT